LRTQHFDCIDVIQRVNPALHIPLNLLSPVKDSSNEGLRQAVSVFSVEFRNLLCFAPSLYAALHRSGISRRARSSALTPHLIEEFNEPAWPFWPWAQGIRDISKPSAPAKIRQVFIPTVFPKVTPFAVIPNHCENCPQALPRAHPIVISSATANSNNMAANLSD
jgi:hypothetical protein